jgi:hypothetical protein
VAEPPARLGFGPLAVVPVVLHVAVGIGAGCLGEFDVPALVVWLTVTRDHDPPLGGLVVRRCPGPGRGVRVVGLELGPGGPARIARRAVVGESNGHGPRGQLVHPLRADASPEQGRVIAGSSHSRRNTPKRAKNPNRPLHTWRRRAPRRCPCTQEVGRMGLDRV